MLPRTKTPHRGARQGAATTDFRKVILAVMVLVFVAYFAVINAFFSFSPATRSSTATVAVDDPINAAASTITKSPHAVIDTIAPTEPPTPKHNWVRNPDRKYVWLDVAIDGVYVGRVTAELYSDIVPKTTENFRVMATGEQGPELSFKDTVCHRILTGFIVQCGDLTTGHGVGGRSIYGGKFDDEPSGLRLTHSKRYILQMANAGPNTNVSQFCFMLGPAPHLNGRHVVFGEVVEGFEVVDKMEAAGVARDGVALTHKVSFTDGGEFLD